MLSIQNRNNSKYLSTYVLLIICIIFIGILPAIPQELNDSSAQKTQEHEKKPKIELGLLEINPHIMTYLSRNYSMTSSIPLGLEIGILISPWIEVGGLIKSWSIHSFFFEGDNSYIGKILLNYKTKPLGVILAIPYAFIGAGIASVGVVNDIASLKIFGAGLKTFLFNHVALRIEYNYTSYSEGSYDNTLSIGLSFFPFKKP